MFTTETLSTFILAVLLLQISPGPDMMLVLARGVSHGIKTALLVVTGITVISGIVQIGFLALGLTALIQSHPFFLTLLRVFGSVYLAYIGLKMLTASRGNSKSKMVYKKISSVEALKEGAINNFTNPKVMLFLFAFLPQFVNVNYGQVTFQLIILGFIQKSFAIIILSAIAIASGTVGKIFNRYPAAFLWQQRFTGCVMFLLAIRLLLIGNSS